MPATRLMGGETEYAIAIEGRDGLPLVQESLLRHLVRFADEPGPAPSLLPEGHFLTNGGLLYLDAGLHLEWATPECISPHDVVRYLRAGDLIVSRLVGQYASQRALGAAFCSRCNVDYVARTSWASHESYLHACSPDVLPDQFLPFLASRVVVCGAGGWDVAAPGLEFTLSPRAAFTTTPVGIDTQRERALFNTRNEPLSTRRCSRLHVACAESLCSDLGTWLRFGVTALVLAIVELGDRPGDGVGLTAPLRALWQFAADPTCRARASLRDGRRLTAVELQRHYLAAVETRLDHPALPIWAEQVCARWRQVLDALDDDPARLSTSLDWCLKRAVFGRGLASRGLDWDQLKRGNAALRRHRSVATSGGDLTDSSSPGGPAHAPLEAIADARPAMFELDMRFGEIGPKGIFASIDASGQLVHRVPGVDDCEGAVTEPPAGTRAALRGAVVRRLAERGVPYVAHWTEVRDLTDLRVLDLGDPFETTERWMPLAEAQRRTGDTPDARGRA